MTTITDMSDVDLAVAVEKTESKDEGVVFEESVLDEARPIIPAPANLAPTPPATTEAAPVLPQPQTGSLDLTEPILDILTNPAV